MSIEARLERQARQADALAERVRIWLAPLRGDERALDAGCGVGALALALPAGARSAPLRWIAACPLVALPLAVTIFPKSPQ